MTGVVKYNGLALNLLPEEREVVVACQGTSISVIKKNDLEEALLKIIEKTYLVRGWTYDGKAGVIQARECVKDLKEYFSTLTIEEISLAFARGVRQEYGEYVGLNVATYFIWIRTYFTSSTRLEAKKKQLAFKLQSEKPAELTEQQKQEILKQGALDAFEHFKKDGTCGWNNEVAIYNWLDKIKGEIKFTAARKKFFMEQAKENLIKQLTGKKETTPDIYERRRIGQQIINLNNEKDNIVNEAKRVALRVFFKELIEMDQQLKDLL